MKAASFWTFNDDYETYGTGFAMFGKEHLITLTCIAVVCAIACVFYRRSSDPVRKVFLRIWTVVPLVFESVEHIILIFTLHPYNMFELPLQICNLFMVVGAIHAFKPTKITGEWIYSLGIVSPLMALLSPHWTRLPIISFYSLIEFVDHGIVFSTPLILVFGKSMRPNFRNLGKVSLLMAVYCAILMVVNNKLGTNFGFLNWPIKGTFLEVLGNWFSFVGSRGWLAGMGAVVIVVWTVQYLPWILIDVWKKKKGTP